MGPRGVGGLGIECQSKAVGKACEVVEHPDDVRDLQTGMIVEPECPQRSPIVFNKPCGCRTQLVCDFAECPSTIVEALDFVPRATLDRLDEFSVPALDTQKLCVRLGSIVAVLG